MEQLSTEDRRALKGVISEISNSMTRSEAERDFVRDAIKDASDKYQIPKKTLKAIAKAYHKQNLEEERSSFDEFVELYDSIVHNTK